MIRIALIISLLVVINTIKAGTIIVQNTNDNGVGSLRQATTDALHGDTIRFNPNLILSGNDTIKLTTEIAFNKGIVLKGLYNLTDTLFISGEGAVRIFNINLDTATSKNIVFDSLVLINGNAGVGNGGAISLVNFNNCLLLNSQILTSQATNGGGLCFLSSIDFNVNLTNSLVNGNMAISGGGIYSAYISYSNTSIYCKVNVSLNNSIVSYNSANSGGGIYSNLSSYADTILLNVHVTNSEISNNNAVSSSGGGFCSFFNTVGNSSNTVNYTITNSSVYNNNATSLGGGIYSYSYNSFTLLKINFTVANSTFYNNNANEGGGINIFNLPNYYASTDLNFNLINSTIYDNNATKGGGFHIKFPSSSSYPVSSALKFNITNSTVYKNKAIVGGAIYASSNANTFTSIITPKNSIIALNGDTNIYNNSFSPINSLGYNIFSDPVLTGSIASDYLAIDSAQLNLGYLANNGGNTLTLSPLCGSIAIDNGNPIDFTNAQNTPIFGTRDIGSAEYLAIQNLNSIDTIVACDSVFFGSSNYFNDSLIPIHYTSLLGCDSVVLTQLIVNKSTVTNINNVAGCDSVNVNGNWYFSSQTVSDTLYKLLTGCDSIINYAIVVNLPTTTNLPTINSCDSAFYSGVIYYNDTTINTTTIGGASNGCNLYVNQQIVIESVDNTTSLSGLTITANQAGASYQWIECNNEKTVITGATNQSFTPLKTKNYAVVISKGPCQDTSACVAITISGINENKLNYLKTYPNPTNDLVFIDGITTLITIKLLNSMEQVIIEKKFNKSDNINLSDYENGAYFLLINDGENSNVIKIIKN